jgi:hypothetical protein
MIIEELYTTKQVADILGLQPKTIANSRYTGMGINIPFIKIGSGGVVRYKKSELEAYLDENTFQHNGETKAGV